MREIVLDTETTGLIIGKDRLFEIALVELFDKIPTGNFLHFYCNPEVLISEIAFKITGIANKFLVDKPPFSTVWPEISSFIANTPLVAHNASFDVNMINYELQLMNLPLLSNKIIDTLFLARKKFRGAQNNLDALAKRFNVSNQKRGFHNALEDTYLTAKIYYFLAQNEEDSLDFLSSEVVEENQSGLSIKPRNNPGKINEIDLQKHLEMIQLLNIKE